MRFLSRLALLCSALLVSFALAPRPLAAQSGAIGIRGDVNRDGSVTAVDALAILSHVVGKPLPAFYTVELDGDADGSGEVTAVDALVILGHAVGKDVARYPVGQRVLAVRVGAAGGSVSSRPDSIRLDLPEGTLSAATLVTVRPAEALSGAADVLAGTALAVGAEGASLARPVRLTLHVNPAALPEGASLEALRIHRRVGEGWEEVPGGSVDTVTGTVAAELPGAGTYAVRAGASGGLRLVREAGDGQTGVVGRPPADFLAVRLVSASGRGVPGVELAWTVTEGGGSVRPLAARTDGEGRVRAVFTLGAVPGTNRVRVSATGADSTVFTAQGVADAPSAAVVVAGADQTATAGSAVATAPAVRVADSAGNPVIDVPVTFAVATGGGSVTGGAVRTDAGGVATVGSWTLGTVAGPNSLTATVQGGPTATISATGLPGAAASISIRSGDGGTATVATTRALEARVVDAHGNGVAGVTVSWAVASGGGSLSAPGSATDASGVASTVWTFGGTVGTQSAAASATGLAGSPLTFTASTTPAAASQLTLTTQPSATAQSGIALAAQPTAQLRDAFGNAVPQAGVAVTAAIAAGGGALGGTATVSTDAGGAAAFTDLSVSGTVGPRTLSFSAAGVTAATSGAVDVSAGTAA
ncbi:MAG TPA: dockerin type I domain-containing protein, partial [Longimicrobiaceae bacterium]|nr:dockerin type I domain-containing protein [Longimicrobiaceae bacterium]